MKSNSNPFYLRSPEVKRRYNRDLFDRIATKYDRLNKYLSLARDSAWKKAMAGMLPLICRPVCLDLACGTGDMTFRLAEKYPGGYIHGLDISREMIDLAKSGSRSGRVDFVLADICRLPFPDNSIDVVTGCYALRNSPELVRTLEEVRRVLKPEGTACFMDCAKPAGRITQAVEYAIIKLWGGMWGWFFFRDIRLVTYLAESLRTFPDSRQLHRLLADHNLEVGDSRKYCLGAIEIILCKNCKA